MAWRQEDKYVRRRVVVALVPFFVLIVFGYMNGAFNPLPDCQTVHGAHDDTTCVYAGHAYRHGVQVD